MNFAGLEDGVAAAGASTAVTLVLPCMRGRTTPQAWV